MKRTLRLVLPIAAVVAAVVAGVLLATRLWEDGKAVQEAAATPAEFGVCNVSVSNIPPDVKVAPFLFPVLEGAGSAWQPGKSGELIFLRVSVPVPPGQEPFVDEFGLPVGAGAVLINAVTGEIAAEGYRTPAAEAKIKGVLATLRVGPWEPAGSAWPRTDTPPTGEVVEIYKPVEVLADYNKVTLKYRRPEHGSGMFGGITQGDNFSRLRAYTCDSIVEVDAWTGKVLRKEVVPQEEAMFQRFLGEVEALP
jgi:hypothetical protein